MASTIGCAVGGCCGDEMHLILIDLVNESGQRPSANQGLKKVLRRGWTPADVKEWEREGL